jgi:hypothetical protein
VPGRTPSAPGDSGAKPIRIPFPRIFPHLFFLFLTSPVLSPEISGVSVYLFAVVPLLDPGFLRYLRHARFRKRYIVAGVLLSGLSVPYGSVLFLTKIATILLVVSYLHYTWKFHSFLLYHYIALNVGIAAVQWGGDFFLGRNLLFPADVGNFLYGPYALATGGTGIEGYLLESRFSGLSREPGFFSSLLIASLILLSEDERVSWRKALIGIHLLGIVLCLSKISLVFFLIFVPAWLLRGVIDRIPPAATAAAVLVIMVLATRYVYDLYGPGLLTETISHRTIGYALLRELNWKDFLFGVGYRNIASRASEIPLIYQSIWFEKMPSAITEGSGLASIAVNAGILYLAFLLLLTQYLGVRSYELLLFLAFTINENPLASSSFVLVGIFYILFVRTLGGSTIPGHRTRVFRPAY